MPYLANSLCIGSSAASASASASAPAGFTNTYSVALDGINDKITSTFNPYTAIGAGDFTLSGWAKLSDLDTSYSIMYMGPSQTSTDYVHIFYWQPDNALRFQSRNGPAGNNNIDTTPPVAGDWYHYALKRTSGTVNAFVNGVSVGTSSDAEWGTNFSSGGHAALQLGNVRTLLPLDGRLNNISVFTSALSDTDITNTLYNGGTPGDLTSLSPHLWYRTGDNDGGTGTTITDQGSGGNDGTLVNGASFVVDAPSS